jgi:hypothetical protein
MSQLSEAARAFADGDVALLPTALSAGEAEALVALLSERGDAARLQRLGEATDKALAKRARKALHLLRTKGIAAPPPAKREFRPTGPHAPADDLSLASGSDGRGERVVWLVRPAEGGYDIFEAQLSETRGILGFVVGLAPRRQWRQQAAQLLADERLGAGHVTERHARQLIEDGYQRTLAVGRVPPDEFARARLSLGHFEPETRHPALDLVPALGRTDARPRLAQLHELPLISMWIPPEELLPELDLEIGNIVTSKLVVEPAQRRAQLHAAIRKLADKTLTPEYRAQLGTRLQETALLLAARGQHEMAQLCMSAAELTLDASVAAEDNPFVLRLFEKVVREPESTEEPEEPKEPPRSPGGLILP